MIVYGKSHWNRIHFKCSLFDASNVSPYLNVFLHDMDQENLKTDFLTRI